MVLSLLRPCLRASAQRLLNGSSTPVERTLNPKSRLRTRARPVRKLPLRTSQPKFFANSHGLICQGESQPPSHKARKDIDDSQNKAVSRSELINQPILFKCCIDKHKNYDDNHYNDTWHNLVFDRFVVYALTCIELTFPSKCFWVINAFFPANLP